ncbi:hypothetical protein PspLS_11608 [Pyricularia sp. CBS 133598]|nr:hypothetical protein PspLS_11608 [Pyricularia sp. CBS 133598]
MAMSCSPKMQRQFDCSSGQRGRSPRESQVADIRVCAAHRGCGWPIGNVCERCRPREPLVVLSFAA